MIKNKLQLKIIRALSGSGKSTFANAFILKNPGWVKVERDDIRRMLFGQERMWKGDERLVTVIQAQAIQNAFDKGYSVICSDTNLNTDTVQKLKTLAATNNAEVEIDERLLDTPVQICLERDEQRENKVGSKVILGQYNRYLAKPFVNRIQDETKPKAICFDLDGTVALFEKEDKTKGHYRNPYDASTCENDLPNYAVLNVLDCLQDCGYTLLGVSGREDKYREQTERWLRKHHVVPQSLYMRKTGDNRQDALIKEEIYENEILPNYYVEAVFDDRWQVVSKLRSLGLNVFQVADGLF